MSASAQGPARSEATAPARPRKRVRTKRKGKKQQNPPVNPQGSAQEVAAKLPPLDAFFAGYRFTFAPDRTESSTAEFRRLCRALNITPATPRCDKIKGAFADAMALQFGERYGTDLMDLKAWKLLCVRIGVEPVPDDLEGARNVVYSADVNLVDLTDDDKGQGLSKRRSAGKIFPIGSSKTGELLASLLAVQMGADPSAFAEPNPAGCPDTTSDGGGAAVVNHSDHEVVAGGGIPVEHLSEQFQGLNVSEGTPRTANTGRAQNAGAAPDPHIPDDGTTPLSPLPAFFTRFEGFKYNPSKSATSEFKRLWKKHLKLNMNVTSDRVQKDVLYFDWSDAMSDEFGERFGVDVHDLAAWQRLCQRIDVTPVPDVLEEAREAVFNSHVNLVDLLGNGVVKNFPTELQLSKYTLKGRVFPRRGIPKNDILEALLRYILFPPPEGSRRNSRGRLVGGVSG